MRRRSRAGSAKSRRGKPARLKRPSGTARGSATGQASEIARVARDRDEALEQLSAASEVLKVISSFPGDLKPVFDAMLKNATRICDANFGTLFRFDGSAFHLAARFNTPPALADFQKQRGPFLPPHDSNFDRMMRTRKLRHSIDEAAEPVPGAAARLGGARSAVYVPIAQEDELIGTFVIYRQKVNPFSEKQIALLTNFAAQAAIAIENARLLNKLKQRTADLSESLEQQTATSDVLRVISSSQGELEPVFAALLEKAVRVCDAKFGIMYRYDGKLFEPTAWTGIPQPLIDHLQQRGAFQPLPGTSVDVMLRTRAVVRTTDDAAERTPGAPGKYGGARSTIIVPMFKDDELTGAIGIYRQEVRPFSDKQSDLVSNFAAQAVIAIENARLLNELRESLDQQTATADVLRIISSSLGDLKPVFSAMLESAARLCDASFGNIFRWDGQTLRLIATYNTPAAFEEARSRIPLRGDQDNPIADMLAAKAVVHVTDLAADERYTKTHDPNVVDAVEVGGVRTFVAVPMFKDSELIGALIIYSQSNNPRPMGVYSLLRTQLNATTTLDRNRSDCRRPLPISACESS